jgi:hypothetical protein
VYRKDVIDSPALLANILDTSEQELLRLAARAHDFYKPNPPKRKPDGRIRQTYSVCEPLKALQNGLVAEVLRCTDYPHYLQGSIYDPVRPRSYVSNATLHLGQAVVFGLDIRDFFPSIRYGTVLDVWLGVFSFPDSVSEILAKLTTLRDFLPQGAPTSSYIANLVLWDVEPGVEAILRSCGYVYSRYVDDITLSSRKNVSKSEKQEVITTICSMLQAKGFHLNRRKLLIKSKAMKPTVHRLRVDGKKLTMDKAKRSKIRAAVHECEIAAQTDRTSAEYRKLWEQTSGRLGEQLQLHPGSASYALANRMHAIKPLDDSSLGNVDI